MELRERILNLFYNEKYGPLLIEEIKDILEKENCDITIEKIENEIHNLENEYLLYKSKKNRYGLLKYFNLYKGIIHIKKQGYGFFESDELDDDAYINMGDTLDSFDGDTVLAWVNSYSFGEKKQEGKVIKIIKRKNDFLICEVVQGKNGLKIKSDTSLIIVVEDFKNAVPGDIVKIKLKDNNSNNLYVFGDIEEIIGNLNTPLMDVLEVAYKYGFSESNTRDEDVLKEIDELSKEYALTFDQEIKKRRRVDDVNIITIDGEDAKDLDDAISVKKLENGNYELGVYIADVSHFVKAGSLIDKNAYLRATSVYLTNKVLPMLPFKLCNDLCSLNEQSDKFVMACVMEINNIGDVVDFDIFEGVINTKHRMTYSIINEMIDNHEVDKIYYDIIDDVQLMEELSLVLREKRYKRGSLNFDIPEAKISLDENGKVLTIEERTRGEGERLIEEFMILANETVASCIYNMDLPFIYRVHDEPNGQKLEKFNKILLNSNYKFKTKFVKNKIITPVALQSILKEADGVDLGLSEMLLRLMAKAVYSSDNIGHFGLASSCYTHFTSPIRRYPDLIVHRLLKEYVIHSEDFYSKDEDLVNKKEYIEEQAKWCSEQERRAIDCEYEVNDMKMAEYMEEHIGEVFEAKIVSVTNFGLFVRLPNLIEGLISVMNLNDDYYEFDEIGMMLIGRSKHKRYRIGDELKVECINASKETRQIDFKIASSKKGLPRDNKSTNYRKKKSNVIKSRQGEKHERRN